MWRSILYAYRICVYIVWKMCGASYRILSMEIVEHRRFETLQGRESFSDNQEAQIGGFYSRGSVASPSCRSRPKCSRGWYHKRVRCGLQRKKQGRRKTKDEKLNAFVSHWAAGRPASVKDAWDSWRRKAKPCLRTVRAHLADQGYQFRSKLCYNKLAGQRASRRVSAPPREGAAAMSEANKRERLAFAKKWQNRAEKLDGALDIHTESIPNNKNMAARKASLYERRNIVRLKSERTKFTKVSAQMGCYTGSRQMKMATCQLRDGQHFVVFMRCSPRHGAAEPPRRCEISKCPAAERR